MEGKIKWYNFSFVRIYILELFTLVCGAVACCVIFNLFLFNIITDDYLIIKIIEMVIMFVSGCSLFHIGLKGIDVIAVHMNIVEAVNNA